MIFPEKNFFFAGFFHDPQSNRCDPAGLWITAFGRTRAQSFLDRGKIRHWESEDWRNILAGGDQALVRHCSGKIFLLMLDSIHHGNNSWYVPRDSSGCAPDRKDQYHYRPPAEGHAAGNEDFQDWA
jgi:hypothetical protein